MLPILQRAFLFISFHLLGMRGPKQKGGENSGLTSCVINGQNGNQLRTPAFVPHILLRRTSRICSPLLD